MRLPAAAIAWEFRRRHRWGLAALILYLAVLATIRLLVLGPGQRVTFDDDLTFALVVAVPLATTFMYFLAVFSFGLAGDLAGRRSMYPPRMFTLPVTSAALVGWPMLYGTVAMAILWFATRLLAVWPSGVDVPVIWPALLAAVILAWTQALTWMPYALPGVRGIAVVVMMILIDVVVLPALYFEVSEPVMLALLAPHLPLAYLAARFAVARARRGEVPDWREIFVRRGRTTNVLPRRGGHFSSPASAQKWFEWRRHGRSLPALVGTLLPFELSLLFAFGDTPAIVFATLLAVLVTPPFMAAFVAATVSRPSPAGADSFGLTPFLATRPLSGAALVAAKLKVTIRSTFAAWLLVLVAISLAAALSGTSAVLVDGARHVAEVVGTSRAVGIGLLLLGALVVSTWKQLVQSLYIGMSGRAWLVKGSVFLALALLTVAVPLAYRVAGNRAAIARLWLVLPSVLAVLACFKIAAAAWIAGRLHESRLLGDRTLVLGALAWNVAVLAIYGLLAWLVPGILVPGYVLVLVAILAVPLVRLSAAPLALAWNRHR